jgi:hypothetical protein
MISYGAAIRKNPNIIPDGALIGGVANFYTSTKPTIRVDQSALVVGDLWFNPSTGMQGFWNGTYWLDLSRTNISIFNPPNFANFGEVFLIPITSSFFIEEIIFGGHYNIGTQPNWSGSNSFVLNFEGTNGTSIASPVTVNSLINVTQQATTHYVYRQIVSLNAAFTSTPSNTAIRIRGSARVGTPVATNNITASVLICVRNIL